MLKISGVSDLKDLIKKNIVIVQNTGYLTIIELVHLLLPFVALPYVLRTIGVEKYGMVAFAQTIVSYFTIVINYGLDVYAVKEVAVNRDNKNSLNEIVSTVISVKLILFILSFGIFLICFAFVPFMSQHKFLMFCAIGPWMVELLFPIWFFQGVEKMKYVTIVNCMSMLFYASTVFIFVNQESDFELVALLQSLGQFLAGCVAFYCLIIIEKVTLHLPKIKLIKEVFKQSFSFWLSRVSSVFNVNLAKTVSGLVLSMESVAAFDLAQKIVNAILIPTRMLNKAAYPNIARSQNKTFATKFLFIVAIIAFSLSSMICLLAPFIIEFFSGYRMQEAIDILRILCVFSFSTSIVICVGGCMLVSFGYPKPFNQSVIFSTFFLCFIYALFYVFNVQTSSAFALALVMTDLFVLTYRVCYCRKYGLFSLKSS